MKHESLNSDSTRCPSCFGRIAWMTAAAVLVIGWGSSQLRAEDPLPKGAEILDKYVEATGGKAAYAKIKNRLVKGTLEVIGQGMKGSTETYTARPNLLHATVNIEAFGKSLQGCNGEIVWDLSPMMGPSIKEGAERALMLREATFNSDVHWRKLYKKAECVGTETRDGKTLYKVLVTPNEGSTETHYYDKDSHLRLYVEMNLEMAMGTMSVTAAISDYRAVDGVLYPHKTKQTLMGMQQVLMTTESIKHNVEIPDGLFELPAEIKALVKKQADSDEKETP